MDLRVHGWTNASCLGHARLDPRAHEPSVGPSGGYFGQIGRDVKLNADTLRPTRPVMPVVCLGWLLGCSLSPQPTSCRKKDLCCAGLCYAVLALDKLREVAALEKTCK
ncbi:hypothetical protein WMY93_008631 [Mugilogobius chulae]|uniref:Uncharacterized protein n=1 Tax=Mugilogobius chulae TaxID=88201 RepID=A0AAW0PGI2_9GOBI